MQLVMPKAVPTAVRMPIVTLKTTRHNSLFFMVFVLFRVYSMFEPP